MTGIVLIGVMVDRPTLTFRTLTVAAFGVLLLAPEAIVHPSFQMSFAATLALVAGGLAVVNPCGFPLLPAFLSFYLGADEAQLPRASTRVVPGNSPASSKKPCPP